MSTSARRSMLLLAFLSIAIAACNDPDPLRRVSATLPFLELDAEVTSTEERVINSSTAFLSGRSIDGRKVRWFREVFGGSTEKALPGFLSERIRYILSENTTIESRIRVDSRPVQFDPPPESNPGEWFGRLSETETGRGATNLSALFFLKKAVEPESLEFEINGRLIAVESTRVGIMQLGPMLAKVPPLVQAGVLLHEARHSDCTGGIWRSDIQRTAEGKDPENLACGHLHVLCPEGHDYAGLYACDGEAWGAYTVNFLYFASLSLSCTNCSDEERILAEAAAADAGSRLLIDVDAMVAGRLGRPDMSSSSEVVER